jgi:hypothetical protein
LSRAIDGTFQRIGARFEVALPKESRTLAVVKNLNNSVSVTDDPGEQSSDRAIEENVCESLDGSNQTV